MSSCTERLVTDDDHFLEYSNTLFLIDEDCNLTIQHPKNAGLNTTQRWVKYKQTQVLTQWLGYYPGWVK